MYLNTFSFSLFTSTVALLSTFLFNKDGHIENTKEELQRTLILDCKNLLHLSLGNILISQRTLIKFINGKNLNLLPIIFFYL